MKEHKKLQELLNKPEDCKSTHIYSDSSWYADNKKTLRIELSLLHYYWPIHHSHCLSTTFCDLMEIFEKIEKCVESESFSR